MIRQIPLKDLSRVELIPQAIIAKPTSYFADKFGIKFSTDQDDLDQFEGAALVINDHLQIALKHYHGYPESTTTVYLPYEIRDLKIISETIRRVVAELQIPNAWIAWQRSDGPDL